MTAMHTGEIDQVARKMLCGSRTRWLGVFARDQLNRLSLDRERRPFALVFNTHPSDGPGEHWLAMFAEGGGGGKLEFFDSYGLGPSLYDIHFPVRYSQTSVQSFGTNVCGQFCLMFILYRTRHLSFPDVIHNLAHRYSDASVALAIRNLTLSPCQNGQSCSNKQCF